MLKKDASELLGCEINAPPEEIKKRYRILSMRMHPDRPGGSQKLFVRLHKAYEVMMQTEDREIITKNMFDRFRDMYMGSEEEKEEIISLYKKYKGAMVKIVENLLLGEDEQEERYRKIIDEEIEKKNVPIFPKYASKPLMQNKRRQEKRQREKEAAEKLAKQMEERRSSRKEKHDQIIAKLEEEVAYHLKKGAKKEKKAKTKTTTKKE